MFESEATKFQSAGIQIGADSTQAEEQLLTESLAPFSISRRNNALEMARLYAVLHCFENEIREYIRECILVVSSSTFLAISLNSLITR